jgi:hypothetical protein
LEGLGFCWNIKDAAWDKMFAELVAYKEAHGHCNVVVASGPLGMWCSNVRQEALGFCWDHHRIRKLKKTVADLAKFKAEHGHCNVSGKNESFPQRIRTLKEKRETLPPDILAELNALGLCRDSAKEIRRKSKSLKH